MTPKRKWAFRTLAIALGLSTFVAFEGICRVMDWGAQPTGTDAFAEFAAVRPLFQYSEKNGHWHIAQNRREYFAEESFPGTKTPTTFRIFIFGGSTVQGRPFSIPTSFGTFLQIGLRAAAPDVDWEVVNCGGISYASYRLLPIMQECLQHEPDLYIVCTGHNEFLECITYSEVRQSPEFVKKSYSWLHQFKSFHLASQCFQTSVNRGNTPTRELPDQLAVDVDAMLDHQGGLEAYNRAALHRDDIVKAFETNVRDMVAMAKSATVPLLFVQPPSNLRDSPPFKSQFSNDVDAGRQQSILQALKTPNAIPQLESAAQADPHFALSWYQLGQALLDNKHFDEAKQALTRARDEDVCPLRMTSKLEENLRFVAEETKTHLLDAQELLAVDSRNGIVGDAVLVDHVHPSFRSNQQIAVALVDDIAELNLIDISEVDWEGVASKAFAGHLQSLDNLYYLRGQRTLKTLAEWTQGRADGPPLTLRKRQSDTVSIAPESEWP